MKFSIFTIISIIGLISSWSEKALSDGKITLDEALQLIIALSERLGVNLEFDVTDYLVPVSQEDQALLENGIPDFSDTPQSFEKPEE